MQNSNVLFTRSLKTGRKLYESFPIVQKNVQRRTQEFKAFKRYMDDIACTGKGNPQGYLEYVNSLHNNLQFTLETPNANGNLTFMDLKLSINDERQISCHWFQKFTDTGINLNFFSGARLQHKKM